MNPEAGFSLSLPPELLAHLADEVAVRVAPKLSPPTEPFITADQAASYMACRRERIYELKDAGKIRFYRDGRRTLFRRSDLDRYVSAQSHEVG